MDLYIRFFSISRMSSARTDVAMAQIQAAAEAIGDGGLARLAADARRAAAHTADVEQRYRLQSNARGGGDAAAADKRMDVAIGGFFDGATDEIDYLRSVDDPRADRLQRVLDAHFAGQVSTITRAPYEDELQRVERLHTELTGTSAQLMRETGLARWVDRIAENLGPYRVALNARSRVTRGDLVSARAAMHVATCAVVAHVCSTYVDDYGRVAALLAPLVDQQDRIAAIMRARRQGAATGSVDSDLIDGDGDSLDPIDDEVDGVGDGMADAMADDLPDDIAGAEAGDAPAEAQPVAPAAGGGAPPPALQPLPGGG